LGEKATSAVRDVIAEGDLPVLPLTFIAIDGYTTFRAEFAITEGDLVFHFFVTDEVQALQSPKKYWHELFPQALSDVADKHFNVTFPRLKAAYTPEQASWWMRAVGFGKVLDPHRFSYKFFDALDSALDAAMPKAT
jgi:hypothetical protein